jgi:dihydroorotate dehydrogenase
MTPEPPAGSAPGSGWREPRKTWQRPFYEGIRPLLFLADPEWIHDTAVTAARKAAEGSWGRAFLSHLSSDRASDTWAEPRPIEAMGLRFPNRVGLAAGFDKDGEAVAGWAALGLGFAEVGTVTPQPQAGNPRPRLWRLVDDDALVNRMGFNNAGATAVADRVARARPWLPGGFVVGVSIGRGTGTADDVAERDYLDAYRIVAPVADYVAVNVSSPNTEGLAALEAPDRLVPLIGALAAIEPRRPLVVKVSADQPSDRLTALADALGPTAAAGLIVANTSRSRAGLRGPVPLGAEEGGLSGRPLLAGMLAAIGAVRGATGDRFTLIGSGGIFSGADARRAVDAGADLVQLWTGLIYAGPGLIGEVVDALTSAPI